MGNIKIIEKKGLVVNEITEKVSGSESVIIFDYQGLGVAAITELRCLLRDTDSELKVYKNSLARRAMGSLNYDLDETLTGANAMVISNNLVEPIKVLTAFSKTNPGLEIKVGIIEGEVKGLDVINKLSSIPTREGLLTMLAGGLIGTVKNLSVSLHMYEGQLTENQTK